MEIPYGEALGLAIWNYFKLSDYFRLRWSAAVHVEEEFWRIEDYWRRVIRNNQETNFGVSDKPKLHVGNIVKLSEFTLTEWVPWIPGMYHTSMGFGLRLEANKQIEGVVEETNSKIHNPYGSSITVACGVGSIRAMMHDTPDGRVKIIGASTGKDMSGAVPVIFSQRAYDRIKDRIERNGSVRASIEGTYVEMPEYVDEFLHRSVGIPRSCIIVKSPLNVRDIQDGG